MGDLIKVKKCKKCGEIKPLTEFNKDRKNKDGLRSHCKSCIKESNKRYRDANKEYFKGYSKKYYEANKEYFKKYNKEYREENKESIKEWYQENKEAIKEYKKKYYEANKEARKDYFKKYREANKEYFKKYREANKESIKERKKRYREENKEAIKEYKRNYYQENKEHFNNYKKERYTTDPEYRTSCLLRKQTRRLGDFKNTGTIELVGCSPAEFWIMNGSPSIEELQDLHIDHIVPLSWFNLSNEDHVKVCNNYLNLQYLNSKDNLEKKDRYAGRPDNILGYKEDFDIDEYVSDTLKKIKALNLHI